MRKRVVVTGSVPFAWLSEELKWDLSTCVATALERKYGRLIPKGRKVGAGRVGRALLEDNVEVALVEVDPRLLNACKRMTGAVHAYLARKYEAAFRDGATFPPVVVNSTARNMLCEGWHRSCAAERAGVDRLGAIDVASIDLEALMRYGDKLLFDV